MNIQIENRYRLLATVIAIVALTVLMLTKTIDHEDGIIPLTYCIGYIVGGVTQFGPNISKVKAQPEQVQT